MEEGEASFSEELGKIHRELNAIKKDSEVTQEDQLFFGLVVSIAFFVITMPLDLLAAFFQSAVKLDFVAASFAATFIKNTSIGSLVLSILLRYYGAVKPHKVARLWSILSLIIGFDIFLFVFTSNIGMGAAIFAGPIAFHLFLLIAELLYVGVGKFAEKKIVTFYIDKGFAPKKYSKMPPISYLFAMLAFSVNIAFAVEIVLVLLVGLPFDMFRVMVVYVALTIIFSVYYAKRVKPGL